MTLLRMSEEIVALIDIIEYGAILKYIMLKEMLDRLYAKSMMSRGFDYTQLPATNLRANQRTLKAELLT